MSSTNLTALVGPAITLQNSNPPPSVAVGVHSAIKENQSVTPRLYKDPVRMLFNLHANEFGNKSTYEGAGPEAMQYFHDFLRDWNARNNLPEIGKFLTRLTTTIKLAALTSVEEFVKETVLTLETAIKHKDSLLLAGGWNGKPGHAIYYEIIYETDTTVTFRIYNTGAGISANHPQALSGVKIKYQPFVDWKGIEIKKLLSPHFLKAIHEMNFRKPVNYNDALILNPYGAHDVYQAFKEYLDPKEITMGKPIFLKSMQLSGVCAVKALCAIVQTILLLSRNDGEEISRKIKCSITVQTLCNFVSTKEIIKPIASPGSYAVSTRDYKNCRNSWRVNKEAWTLVEASMRKTAARVLKQSGDTEADEKSLVLVEDWLSKNKAASLPLPQYSSFKQDNRTSAVGCVIEFSVDLIEGSSLFEKTLLEDDLKAEISKHNSSHHLLIETCIGMSITNMSSPDEVEKILLSGVLQKELSQAWVDGADVSLHTSLGTWISVLPLDSVFWKKACKLDKKKAKEMVTALGEVARLYFQSCFTIPDAHRILPERVFMLFRLQTIQTALVSFITDKQQHFQYNSFSLENYFTGFHPRELEEFYNEIHPRDSRGALGGVLGTGGFPLQLCFSGYHDDSNLILRIVQSLKDEISEELNKQLLASYKDSAERMTKIHCSSHLPAWLMSWRDSNLFMQMLVSVPIARLTKVDRRQNLELVFGGFREAGRDSYYAQVSYSSPSHDAISQDPIFEKRENDCHYNKLSFLWMYGDIHSKPLRLLMLSIDGQRNQEKKLLMQKKKIAKKVGLQEEEALDLLHIFESRTLVPIEALEYFTNNAQLLRDRDYQTIFRAALFHVCQLKPGYGIQPQFFLHNRLKSSIFKGFGDQLKRFIEEQYKLYAQYQAIQPAVFLLHLQRILRRFDSVRFTDTFSSLGALLNRKGIDSEERSVIYSERVSAYSEIERGRLNQEQIESLLHALAYLNEYPVPQKWEDPMISDGLRKAPFIHAKAIYDYLQKDMTAVKKCVNSILHMLRGPQDTMVEWQLKQLDASGALILVSDDGRYRFDPVKGELLDFKNKNSRLPEEIRHHHDFEKLFPEIERADPTIIPGGVLYKFHDKYGHQTHVCRYKDAIIIEQLHATYGWIRFLPKETLIRRWSGPSSDTSLFTSPINSRYLAQEYSHWLTRKATSSAKESAAKPTDCFLLLRQSTEAEVLYYVKIEWNGSNYRVLENPYHNKSGLQLRGTSILLGEFEHPAYVHEWRKNHGELPQLIELPRFALSFSAENGKYRCKQIEGYFLDVEKTTVKQLRSYRHYLRLHNEQDEVKILLPYQEFRKQKDSDKRTITEEVLRPSFVRHRKLKQGERDSHQYLVYDIAKDGSLVSESREANFYAATVMCLEHNYNDAGKRLMHYGNKIGPYTEQEAFLLTRLHLLDKASPNMEGNACAIRMQAAYLLLRNDVMYNITRPKFLSNLQETYLNYLTHIRNATVFRLTRDEELMVLSFIEINDDPVLVKRVHTLNPDHKSLSQQRSRLQQLTFQTLFKSRIKKIVNYCFMYLRTGNCEKKSVTRLFGGASESQLGPYILDAYQIALSENEDQKVWLKVVTCFLKASPLKIEQTYGIIFERFLAHAQALPKLPNDLNRSGEWEKDGLPKIIDTIAYEEDQKKEAQALLPMDLTPIGFTTLPEREPVIKVSVIKFQLPAKVPAWSELAEANFETSTAAEADVKESTQAKEWFEKLSKTAKDELQKQAYEAICKDFAAPSKAEKPVRFKEGVVLAVLRSQLDNGKKEAATKLVALQTDILKLINQYPIDKSRAVIEKLRHLANWRKESTLDEVIACYAKWKKDPAALRRLNPDLSDDEISNIVNQVTEFLLLSTHEQQRLRASKTLDALEKCTAENDLEGVKDLTDQLGVDLSAKHHYIIEECPHYLVFEYYANILMRKDQIQNLKSFMEGGSVHPIKEMIMGSGKSKVLLPLLAICLAESGTLVTFVVPQSLFASIGDDSQRIIFKACGINLRTIHYVRKIPLTNRNLKFRLRELDSARHNGEAVILTNKTLKSLMIKFVEACDSAEPDAPWTEERTLLCNILKCFFTETKEYRCIAIFDEVDSIMNVLRKICFSKGMSCPPNNREVHILMQINQLLYQDPQLKRIARCECDPNPDQTAPILTKEIYEKELKVPLARAFIKLIPNLKLNSKNHEEELKKFASTLTADTTLLENYLCHCPDKEALKKAQTYFNAQAPEVREVLQIAGQLIGKFLVHTRTRINNQNYGIDRESGSAIAIPFVASKVPSRGSQFANPHISMLYTAQSLIQEGFTEEIIKNEIERLQKQAQKTLKEANDELKEDKAKTIEGTSAWEKFCTIRGGVSINSLYPKPVEIAAITEALKKDFNRQFKIIEEVILPQMELFKEQISCNPLNLASFLKNPSGFTGTLYNGGSLHRKFTPQPEPGIDAYTYTLLFRNSFKECLTLNEGKTVEMLEQIKKQFKQVYHVVIDAGGYFKDGTNLEIARVMALFFGQPVVFYNARGEQTVTDGKIETSLAASKADENNRITFLDQDHTTGADVRYKRNAIGVVTIGRNTLIRDLKQAVWRLRRLPKGQKVVLSISEDVKMLIRQTVGKSPAQEITLEDVIQFCIANQCAQEGRDNIQSFMQQLWDVFQQQVFTLGFDSKIAAAEFNKAWKFLRPRWITSGMHQASSKYGQIPTLTPKDTFIADNRKEVVKYLADLKEHAPSLNTTLLQSEIDSIIKHMYEKLPAEILWPPQEDADASVEIELEHEEEHHVEEEVQIEAEIEMDDDDEGLGYIAGNQFQDFHSLSEAIFAPKPNCVPRFFLSLYLAQEKEYQSVAAAFQDIYASINIFSWTTQKSVKELTLFGKTRTPLHFALIQKDQVTILNQQDAAAFQSAAVNEKEAIASDMHLYNLTLKTLDNAGMLSPNVLQKVVKVKFLNGDVEYTKMELIELESWLRKFNPVVMRQFLLNHVLAGRPKAMNAYYGSLLQKLFNKL